MGKVSDATGLCCLQTLVAILAKKMEVAATKVHTTPPSVIGIVVNHHRDGNI